eukprot:901890-Prorocentrum_minimum.AAC.1
MSEISGGSLGGASSASSVISPHTPSTEHVPSSHKKLIPTHGLITTTRRRFTTASLPAESATE